MKYHIGRNGLPSECHAQKQCPLGGDHFNSKVEVLQDAISRALTEESAPPTERKVDPRFQATYLAQTTTDSDELENLSQHTYWEVREAVARNPQTSWATLQKLVTNAAKEDAYVLRALAINRKVTTGQLEILMREGGVATRTQIAQRKSLTERITNQLFTDPNEGVRAAYAAHSNVTRDHLSVLMRDESQAVRLAVVKNPAVDAWYLREIERRPDTIEAVKEAARIHLNNRNRQDT